ncbi:hypothetical protein RsTz2092_09070 [Deferribacterales bacterium RsTz2092]|nr:hypothetical protein AGMMS49941_06810 [Deferribacterales bacterium]
MKGLFRVFLVFALCIAFSVASFAASKQKATKAYPSRLRSVAALGMGDANYTKSDSKYAPFYNPAGLTRIKTWYVDVAPVNASLGTNTMDFVNDLDKVKDDDDATVKLLLDNINSPMTANVGAFPAFYKKNMLIGAYGAGSVAMNITGTPIADVIAGGLVGSQYCYQGYCISQADYNDLVNIILPSLGIVTNQQVPALDLDLEAEGGVALGIGHSFVQDKLQVGVTPRIIKRSTYYMSYNWANVADGDVDFNLDNTSDSTMLMVDVGTIYNFTMDGLNPRVGFALNNIKAVNSGDADAIPTTATVSFGISPTLGPLKTDIIVDYVDITGAYEYEGGFMKHLNAGIEARVLADHLAVRGGIHQGYATFGAGINLFVLKLDFAYYTEEVGKKAGDLKDERYAIEATIGF